MNYCKIIRTIFPILFIVFCVFCAFGVAYGSDLEDNSTGVTGEKPIFLFIPHGSKGLTPITACEGELATVGAGTYSYGGTTYNCYYWDVYDAGYGDLWLVDVRSGVNYYYDYGYSTTMAAFKSQWLSSGVYALLFLNFIPADWIAIDPDANDYYYDSGLEGEGPNDFCGTIVP